MTRPPEPRREARRSGLRPGESPDGWIVAARSGDYCAYTVSGRRCFLSRGHPPYNGYHWHLPIEMRYHPVTTGVWRVALGDPR